MYQYMFERKTSPWEMASWDEGDLQNFEIESELINRLYSIKRIEYDDYSAGSYYLLARMKYKEKNVFVELNASCDSSGFDCQGGGELYVTADATTFYNAMASPLNERESILASLYEDDYDIAIQPEAAVSRVSSWHNPSPLLFLCHVAVRDNKHRLAHYPEVLPKCITESLSEFIRVKEAMDDYSFD